MKSTPARAPRYPASDTRISYQVGRPWIFDGKILRGATGTPMRMIDLPKRVLALAEPEPFTLANLMTKSFVATIGDMRVLLRRLRAPSRERISAYPRRRSGTVP